MYKKYETVLLKDGSFATIVESFGDAYIADVGYSPDDWDTIDIVGSDIERLATKEEEKLIFEKSKKELKKMNLWVDSVASEQEK